MLFSFLGTLAENSRLSKTAGILSAFSKLMSSHRGEVSCTITTAKVISLNDNLLHGLCLYLRNSNVIVTCVSIEVCYKMCMDQSVKSSMIACPLNSK